MINIFKRLFKKKDFLSFQQGFDLTSLPVVTLQQKEQRLNFLLDTGSNNCIIDKSILDKLEYEKIEKQSKLIGIEGGSTIGDMCTITVSYNNKEYPFIYAVCDMSKVFGEIKQSTGVTLHGILGSRFFNEYRYVIDFNELIAYSKK